MHIHIKLPVRGRMWPYLLLCLCFWFNSCIKENATNPFSVYPNKMNYICNIWFDLLNLYSRIFISFDLLILCTYTKTTWRRQWKLISWFNKISTIVYDMKLDLKPHKPYDRERQHFVIYLFALACNTMNWNTLNRWYIDEKNGESEHIAP